MDKSYAIALVWGWLAEHPEYYCSWVNPFTQLRWSPAEERLIATRVGGHWRRLAHWAKVVPALNCTCKFEQLTKPRMLCMPLTATRQRWDEDGEMIPRRYRVLVFA